MTFRTFVGLAFVLNALSSNVCVMGTVLAADPIAGAGENVFLSREVPMSFNVVTCTWVKTDDGWEPTPDSPCASGHCLKKEKPETRCVVTHAHEVMAAQVPMIASVSAATPEINGRQAEPTESPPPRPGHGSTVMRT